MAVKRRCLPGRDNRSAAQFDRPISPDPWGASASGRRDEPLPHGTCGAFPAAALGCWSTGDNANNANTVIGDCRTNKVEPKVSYRRVSSKGEKWLRSQDGYQPIKDCQ